MKLSEFAKSMLRQRYMRPWDEGPEDVYYRAARAFSSNPGHFKRIIKYVENKWLSFATPVLANAPVRTGWQMDYMDKKCFLQKTMTKAMPISCFVNYVDDTVEGLVEQAAETRYMSVAGGGVGAYFGNIRAQVEGGKSPGPIPFIKCLDSDTIAYHQSGTRRSGIAVYLDISHPDIEEFIQLRKVTGGDHNRKTPNLHLGVNITNTFLEAVKDNNSWSLICPKTKKIISQVSARSLWFTILQLRHETGEPYLVNIDEANDKLNPELKALGKRVNSSNLCSEILLPTAPDLTALCCLSSINAEFFDEWKDDENFVADVTEFLDNILEYFLLHADDKKFFRVKKGIKEERNIGIGLMGFHSYLQKNMIPFESALATSRARVISKHIYEKACEASENLGSIRGSAKNLATRRNAHLVAIAPNASTSVLIGCSPGIEPMRANAYMHKLDVGVNLVKNRYLKALLKAHGKNDDSIWQSILAERGSVQHLDFLSKEEKDVFKTAIEIDQHWVVEHGIARQPFVDQAASTNLFFPSEVDISYLHSVHWKAMTGGLKTLYYVRSEPIGRAKINYDPAKDTTCLACEG